MNASSKLPAILQGDAPKRLGQGAVVGGVLIAVIGFSWGGWVTDGTAEKMAAQRETAIMVKLYTPVCVQKFEQQPNIAAQWVAFKKVRDWNRDSFIKDAGLATLPGTKVPHTDVAEARAKAVTEIANKQPPA